MNITSLCALGILTAVAATAVKEIKPEFARVIALAGGVLIMGAAISAAAKFVDALKTFASFAPSVGKLLKPLLKITGIAYLAQFSAELCRDAGESALSSRVELAGKTAIALMSFPIIKEVFFSLMRIIE